MNRITKSFAVAAAAVLMLSAAQAPALAADSELAASISGTFLGTASVDCDGRGCNVAGTSSTCLVIGGASATGACYVSFALTTGGAECSVGTGSGQAAYSAPGVGVPIPLTASNTGRSITAVGEAVDVASHRVVAITINLPAHLCQGNYPFTGTVKYLA